VLLVSPSDTNDKALQFAIRLRVAEDKRLADLAHEAGISKSKLAAELLTELLPSIKAVKTRLQITRESVKP
jgi:DNA-binding phage protein